jgi:hypothetical protein
MARPDRARSPHICGPRNGRFRAHGEVTDGAADHCYPHHNADNGLCAYLPVDTRWRDTVAPWTLQGNLQWLRSRTG